MDEKALCGREVRLFPSNHITSVREAELRATASFLAIAHAVSEFGRLIVKAAGGPGGKPKIACYAEVPFKTQAEGKPHEERPDGVLRVARGKTDWTALIEVKVGDNPLEQDQFDRYHSLARDQGIDAFITISNQSALANGLPPRLSVNTWHLKKVPVVHLSWERLLSEAQLLSRRKQVADTDQQWMLEEWIRYLADPQSRIIEPPQMGKHWNDVLRAAREGNLDACACDMHDVVQRWDAFLRKVALRLRAKLGANVGVRISRAEQKDPGTRVKNLLSGAMKEGQLAGVFRIPDAAGDLSIVVFLQARSVQYSVGLAAPTKGRAKTRINWLLRQLRVPGVPGDLLVKVHWDQKKLCSQGRIAELTEEIDCLLRDHSGQQIPAEARPRSFSLSWTVALPKSKGRSTVPVLEGLADGIEGFYKRVVEGLRPYVPEAPQLPKEKHSQEATAENGPTNEGGADAVPSAPVSQKSKQQSNVGQALPDASA